MMQRFEQIRPELTDNVLYEDKAYRRPDADEVRQTQNFTALTPVKNQKEQNVTWIRNTTGSPIVVSRKRQPIEAFVRLD